MKILNFGSLNIDYVYAVEHFVRAGETLSSQNRSTFCGGKGLNQSIALAKAGAKVFHAGKVGNDGDMLLKRLKNNGVDTSLVIVDDYISTGHAIIQVDTRGQNCILLFGGANKAITESDIDSVLSGFGEGDLLLLQNEISCLPYIIDAAHKLGMHIALNPSPITAELVNMPQLKFVEWFILNEIEGYELTHKQTPEDIVRALRESYGDAKAVLTLGKKGVVYGDGGALKSHGIYNVPVRDTTAAGDTFTGYFLAAVCEGLPTERALELASRASSIAVGREGASDSIPTREEVETAQLELIK